jgi:arylsulfatase A-like enzyme
LFTDAAIEAVKGARQPDFLWLTYNAPHTPWLATEKYRAHYQGKSNEEIAPPLHPKGQAKFDWATYYAVITHLDEAVGRLVAALKQNGQWENTVLFFIGDNGYMSGTRNWSGKVRHWEESIRVPYFVSGGYFSGAYRVDDPVASVDATATWLELAGVKPWKPLAGRSLVSYLKTGKGKCTEAYCTWDDPRAEGLAAAVAVEPFRLVRTKQHKLVVFASKKQSLFDVVADPGENNDLAADPKHAALKRRLQAKLQARMKATGDHAISWLG